MSISIHLFSFHVYVKTFPSCSHTMLISHPFLLLSFQPLFRLLNFSFIYLLGFLSLFKKKNSTLTPHFLHCSPLFPSLCPCLRLLLSVSQTRIPGTVIPLCAAQCERMFNTTRTPGEETGKETDMYTHIDTRCGNAMFHTVLIYMIHDTLWTRAVNFNQKARTSFWLHSEQC